MLLVDCRSCEDENEARISADGGQICAKDGRSRLSPLPWPIVSRHGALDGHAATKLQPQGSSYWFSLEAADSGDSLKPLHEVRLPRPHC